MRARTRTIPFRQSSRRLADEPVAEIILGDLLLCPYCRRSHPVMKWHAEGTAYTVRMLYFDCRGQRYYAGQEDLESCHETKAISQTSTAPRW